MPILTDVFNHWFAQRAIPGSVTKGMITLLKKGGRKGLDDYRPITLRNTELKILARVLANRLPYFSNSTARTGYDTRLIFKRSLTGLNSEFSFSLTSCLAKAEEPSLSYYLLIAGGRIIGFIPFPRVLVLCEMQSASSRV